MQKNSSKKGFTLTELVIVVAVVAVLAAVLIVTFANVIDRANEASASMDAQSLITALLPEMGDGSDNVDLIVFSVKGGKLYAYGFRHNERKMRSYRDVPYGEMEEGTLDANLEAVLAEMVSAGHIKADTAVTQDSWRSPDRVEAVMLENGFKKGSSAIRADYIINDSFFGGEATPPAEEPPSGFSWDDDNNKLLFNGEAYTGKTPDSDDLPDGIISGVLYIDGVPFNGVYSSSLYESGDGLYYVDGKLYTGDHDGYTYRDGIVMISSSGSSVVNANIYGGNYEYCMNRDYTIPEDPTHITETINIVMPSGFTSDYGYYSDNGLIHFGGTFSTGGGAYSYGYSTFKIINNSSNSYSPVSIKADEENPFTELLGYLVAGDISNFEACIQKINAYYNLGSNGYSASQFYPKINGSEYFKTYLKGLDSSIANANYSYGITQSHINTYYITPYNNNELNGDELFTNFVKTQLTTISNSNEITDLVDAYRNDNAVKEAVLANLYSNGEWDSSPSYTHVEPEIIKLLWEIYCSDIMSVGIYDGNSFLASIEKSYSLSELLDGCEITNRTTITDVTIPLFLSFAQPTHGNAFAGTLDPMPDLILTIKMQ